MQSHINRNRQIITLNVIITISNPDKFKTGPDKNYFLILISVLLLIQSVNQCSPNSYTTWQYLLLVAAPPKNYIKGAISLKNFGKS